MKNKIKLLVVLVASVSLLLAGCRQVRKLCF